MRRFIPGVAEGGRKRANYSVNDVIHISNSYIGSSDSQCSGIAPVAPD